MISNLHAIFSNWPVYVFIGLIVWLVFVDRRERAFQKRRGEIMNDIRAYHLVFFDSGVDYIFSYGKSKFSGDENILEGIDYLDKMRSKTVKYYNWYNDIGKDFLCAFFDQIEWTFRTATELSKKIAVFRLCLERSLSLIAVAPMNYKEIGVLENDFYNLRYEMEKALKNLNSR